MTKLCECGCGEPAPIAKKTDKRKGAVKGEAVRFCAGHRQRMALSGGAIGVQPWTSASVWTPDQALTSEAVDTLLAGDDDFAAEVFDSRTRMIEQTSRFSFFELGMICHTVDKRELWRKLVEPGTQEYFHGFDAWVYSALNVSRSSAYAAKKVYEALKEQMKLSEMQELKQCNALRLAKLSSAVMRTPEIVSAAKSATENDFVAMVNKLFPDQHVEPQRTLVADLDESVRPLMDETFGAVRWVYEVENRGDVMENLLAFFMDGKCEREGYTEMTNREAFKLARDRGEA